MFAWGSYPTFELKATEKKLNLIQTIVVKSWTLKMMFDSERL